MPIKRCGSTAGRTSPVAVQVPRPAQACPAPARSVPGRPSQTHPELAEIVPVRFDTGLVRVADAAATTVAKSGSTFDSITHYASLFGDCCFSSPRHDGYLGEEVVPFAATAQQDGAYASAFG